MDYNFNKFLERAKESCKSKGDFLQMLANEDEVAAQSQAGMDHLAKDNYRHCIAVAGIATRN